MSTNFNRDFTLVITGRNALPFANDCVESIEAQVGSYAITTYYIDDASEYSADQRAELEKILERVDGEVLFLKNRHYQIGAIAEGIRRITSPNTIICLLDADDYLLPHAIQTVASAYCDPNIAMTYGNTLVDFLPYQDNQTSYFRDKKNVNTEYPEEVWKEKSFRRDGFRCFHMKTFRKWLWDYIDQTDFLRSSGHFFRASGDSAYIFPMLELLGDPKHVCFIQKPIYVYRLHEGNVHNHDKKSQFDDLEYIRYKKRPYKELDRITLAQHLHS